MSLDRRSAIFMALVGALLLVVVIPIGIDTTAAPPGQIGPAFFPRALAVVITMLALLLACRPSSGPADGGPGDAPGAPSAWAPRLVVGAVTLAYPLAIRGLGFLAASIIAVVICMLAFGERRPWLIAAVALPLPVAMWLLAVHVLVLSLP